MKIYNKMKRFTKALILEGLNIILKFNYFYIIKNFFHQIKRAFSYLSNLSHNKSNFIFLWFNFKRFAKHC